MKTKEFTLWVLISIMTTENSISPEEPNHLHLEEAQPASPEMSKLSNPTPSAKTLALGHSTWDQYLDKDGNIAVKDGIDAIVQDAITASKTTEQDRNKLNRWKRVTPRISVEPTHICQGVWPASFVFPKF